MPLSPEGMMDDEADVHDFLLGQDIVQVADVVSMEGLFK